MMKILLIRKINSCKDLNKENIIKKVYKRKKMKIEKTAQIINYLRKIQVQIKIVKQKTLILSRKSQMPKEKIAQLIKKYNNF